MAELKRRYKAAKKKEDKTLSTFKKLRPPTQIGPSSNTQALAYKKYTKAAKARAKAGSRMVAGKKNRGR